VVRLFFYHQFFVEGFEAKLIPETMPGMNSTLLGERESRGGSHCIESNLRDGAANRDLAFQSQ